MPRSLAQQIELAQIIQKMRIAIEVQRGERSDMVVRCKKKYPRFQSISAAEAVNKGVMPWNPPEFRL